MQHCQAIASAWAVFCLALLLQAAPAEPATRTAIAESASLRAAKVEDFGVVGFRHDFFGTLTVTPFSADRTIKEGAGHSRVTYSGPERVFDPSWVADGVEFVAYRINKNPAKETAECFFPAILGCRYSKVVRVIDDHNLIVNFEYNGGSIETPKVSEKVSGYFFIDCAAALRKMVTAPDRPGTFIFESDRQYVIKGMPNIPFLAKEQKGDMRWVTSQPGKRATIKISAEDAIGVNIRQAPSKIPDGAFFRLDAHDHSLYLDNINIIGPTYTAPTVEPRWRVVMFDFRHGECARTLEIRGCDTFAEKRACAERKEPLPIGATWLAPDLTGIVGGGGRKGDRGDGVMDIVGYQRFNLIDSTWVSWCVHSIKNNDGGGNWITIDGLRTNADGTPVNMVYEAQYAKRGEFRGVMLSFHDFKGNDARRGVHVESEDFSWPMLENQYWTGGTSTLAADSTHLEVDGFSLYFGNNGDWRRELKDPAAYHGILNASDAVLFDRIPQSGDTVPAEKTPAGTVRIWGWGVQQGDILAQDGKQFEIAERKRRTTTGPILGVEYPGRGTGYAHYWEIKFKEGALPAGDRPQLKVVKSRTAYLLDGKPHKALAFFRDDLHGHWQYNRAEVNYEYRNICFNGNFRQTTGPSADKDGEYKGLWEFPVTQEWINCWAMDTDGSERGKPAKGIRSEAFNKQVLQLRNNHPDSKKHDYHILIDGGWLFAQRLNDKMSPVWIRNRPTLIYGSGSFGEPRLCNPVMLDDKGIVAPYNGVSIALVGGHKLNLSNSVFGETAGKDLSNLNVYGNGTLILDNVRFYEAQVKQGMTSLWLATRLANGLQQDAFNLHITGKGGQGAVRLEGTPEDGSLHLTDWKLKPAPYSTTPVFISDGWKKLPGFSQKVTINGKPIAP